LLFAAGLTVSGHLAAAAPRTATISATPAISVATHYVEVRIRRLHLVRPDLIQYPIAYEVIC
jgi:hypothetical protein